MGTSLTNTPWVSGYCPVRKLARQGLQTGYPENSMLKVDTFTGQAVNVWGQHLSVAGVAQGLQAPLVGQKEDHIRFLQFISTLEVHDVPS